MVLDKAKKILVQPICNSCLGRQFAQLLHGYTNDERGKFVRSMVAMAIDRSKEEAREVSKDAGSAGENSKNAAIDHNLDMSNFTDFKFHNLEQQTGKSKKCSVCNDFFARKEKWIDIIKKAMKKYNFHTFLVGTKLSSDLIDAEESLWEKVGIDYCEPLKAEINREIGKLVEKKLKFHFDNKAPDVNIILNVARGRADIEINPIFIYGEYQKLVRGIPQTKWPSGKYKTSVEQIIAKPFMAATKASAHKLHGLGREDIDARCLGWRPFVLELIKPENRNIDIGKLVKKIGKQVRVRKYRLSNIAEVRRVKESRADKTYSIIVECGRDITKADLKRLTLLKAIRQKTPARVLHRRADKYRNRAIRYIKAKQLGKKKFAMEIRCEAGLYVKELVSGDNGRTSPSVSELLNTKCTCKQLDVKAVHAKF